MDAPPIVEIQEIYNFVRQNSSFFEQMKEMKNLLDDEEGGEKGDIKRLEGGLMFLHDMGKVIYFGDGGSGRGGGGGGGGGGIGSKVVVRPQWLTRCLACIVTQEVKGTYIKEVMIFIYPWRWILFIFYYYYYFIFQFSYTFPPGSNSSL